MNADWHLDAYDYVLPPDRIAQSPANPRDTSRLLVVQADTHVHSQFATLPQWLRAGDLLVFNDTRVLPARLLGQRRGGGPAEMLLLEDLGANHWHALVRPGRRLPVGAKVHFRPAAEESPWLVAEITGHDPHTGGRHVHLQPLIDKPLVDILEHLGQIPLPPYIASAEVEPDQYQTIYARHTGSAAAPTAGLHFTPHLLDQLRAAGIDLAWITLHVGVGTFRPVQATDIRQHQMHGEWADISPTVIDQIRATRQRGGRVIAVGTTVTRTLETAGRQGLQPFRGKTDLYIYPGYAWQVVDGLITNFHLPRSSLMMLVSALIGRPRLLALYQEAIDQGYRFYSFGDAMLILPRDGQGFPIDASDPLPLPLE